MRYKQGVQKENAEAKRNENFGYLSFIKVKHPQFKHSAKNEIWPEIKRGGGEPSGFDLLGKTGTFP